MADTASQKSESSISALSITTDPLMRVHHYARQESNIPEKTTGNQGVSCPGGTDSGTLADADDLQTLAAVLRRLSPEARARLAALLLGERGEGKDG
jgi:hypothetical protein